MTRPSEDPADYEFDVAVSFAGEERGFVEEVIRAINAASSDPLRVFYDQENRYESWGKDLIEYFHDVYTNRARYVVMFVSASYADKEWTRHERRTSLMRALRQRSEYILPVRMDNTELADLRGLITQTGYLIANTEGAEGIAAAVRYKIGGALATPVPNYQPRVAKTARELQELIATRPPAWEYLLWASVLEQGRDSFADARRDHALEVAAIRGERLREWHNVVGRVQDTLTDVNHVIHLLRKILDPAAFDGAVGGRGETGDADKILHIGQKFVDMYGRLLEIAADLRGTAVPTEYVHIMDMAAHLCDKPLDGIDAFINNLVPSINAIPPKLIAGESVEMSLAVKVHVDDQLGDQLLEAVHDMQRQEDNKDDIYYRP
ncbi:TIR domain-containing protein [Rhodococcoides fascians]|uniref:TIR domain-containing protein n=1 Tax=Rhodococcoides fascians TaxID=1828 RepID=UPI00068BA767|nr:TIR domain-containing protein [Rhodococcus fascians]